MSPTFPTINSTGSPNGNSLIGMIISMMATATGAALPFLFTYFGLDPALMSAPFITTIVDIGGIFIDLNIAKFLL